MKIDAAGLSESPVNIYQSTRSHIQNTLILLANFLVTIQLMRNS